MTRLFLIPAPTLLVAGLLLTANEREARACSTAYELAHLYAPSDGAKDVPVNSKIWLAGIAAPVDLSIPLELYDSDGRLVPSTPSQFVSTDTAGVLLTVYTPNAFLTPEATYSIRVSPTLTTTFTVAKSAAADLQAPAVPSARLLYAHPKGGMQSAPCGDTNLGVFAVPLGGAAISVLDVAGTAQFTSGPSGKFANFSDHESITVTWRGAAPGFSRSVRFGLFDLAGNFSGWSDAQKFTIPYGGGCVRTGGASFADSGIWLLPFLGLMRKRKKK